MEAQTNVPQPIIPEPSLTPITPPQNSEKFKYLFFISLILFIGIICVLVYFLVKNKTNTNQISTTITPTTIPTPSVESSTNILRISDIEMELPSGWSVSSIKNNTAKILTDYSKYQVYLTLELNKNDSIANSAYESKGKIFTTQYGQIYEVSGGGALKSTGALLNNDKYSFVWDVESNQPTPTNLDGIWKPDNNVTSEIILNITKTVRPTNETSITSSSVPKDWKTYTDKTIGFSFKYPSNIPIYSFPSIDHTVKSESLISIQTNESLSSNDELEKNSIEKGQLPKDAPMGAKIIKLDNGKYAMEHIILVSFEECDVRLIREISFYTDKSKVFIDYQYNHNRSVIPAKYLTTNKNCGEEQVWKDRNMVISDFNNKSFSDKTIQSWFDFFDQIVKTINF